jgi:dinuclear metal center YbgI/SA1388 family protein
LFPAAWAEDWDNVGLLLGDPDALLRSVVLTLDITPQTLDLTDSCGANLIICHHPLIFSPLKSLREDQAEQSLVRQLIQKDIAVLALHTNLDAAPGGTADSLADALALGGVSRDVFLPRTDTPQAGHGRILDLIEPIALSGLRELAARNLGSSGVRLNTGRDRLVQRLGVFPGSFDETWIEALEDLAVDVIITGELKHHVGLMLELRGIAALDAGHDVSERVVLEPLRQHLAGLFPEIAFAVDPGIDYNNVTF